MVIIPGTHMHLGLCGAQRTGDPVPENVVFLNQIHSSRIVVAPWGGEDADGMVMARGSRYPALRVADCLPVFALWDDYIGAAHAGWRGLSQGIIENLLHAVNQPLRWLILGPCICSKCYEVGEQVSQAVSSGDPSGTAGHPDGRIDLRGSAVRRARKVSGDKFRLMNIDECTLESAGLYSYRGNKTAERNFLWLAEI